MIYSGHGWLREEGTATTVELTAYDGDRPIAGGEGVHVTVVRQDEKGYDIYVADAPNFDNWRKMAWIEIRPSGPMVKAVGGEVQIGVPVWRKNGQGTVFAWNLAGDHVRIYRIVPAGEQVQPVEGE